MKFVIVLFKKLFQHDHEKIFFGSVILFFLTFVFYFPAKIFSGNSLEILVEHQTFLIGLALILPVSLIFYLVYKVLYLIPKVRPILNIFSYSILFWTISCVFYGVFRVDILSRFGQLHGLSFENFSVTTQEIWWSLILYLVCFVMFLWGVRKVKNQHVIAFLCLINLIFFIEGLFLILKQSSPRDQGPFVCCFKRSKKYDCFYFGYVSG